MPTPETRRMVIAAASACEEKKADDIRILELDPSESGLCDYFVIASGSNSRQLQAISDEIQFRMKQDFGSYAHSTEGYKQGEWLLLDYVDFVVHLFSEEKRAYYGIERLRRSARNVASSELAASLHNLNKKTAASREAAASDSTPAVVFSAEEALRGIPAKSFGKKSPPKKSAKKSTAKKSAAKKTSAKKSSAKKSTAKTPSLKSAKSASAKPKAAKLPTRKPKPAAKKAAAKRAPKS